ncbi:hypothetical protein [Aegicerativicinus sediminis]|uniref:hypothetical protein n=1 Tax=Aegicerativicinus sediminis TaxID=2893202 RepID=UPI001E2ABFF4|nr:hypothetical protein [Aegicerativicinus sediminis]
MKPLFTIILSIISLTIHAQDPMLQRDAPELEKKAFELTKEYNRQLALDGKQITLFEKKVEEFLIKSEKVKENYSGKEMLDQLFILQKQESMDMGNILTNLQYKLYLKIKPEIQPLATVK